MIKTCIIGVVLLAWAGSAVAQEPVPASRPATRPQLSWAEVLEREPNPKIVKDPAHRAAMERTGLPWRVRDKASGIELLLIPPGTFTMGASPGDQEAEQAEFPAHRVTISRAFYMGRYEVTQAEWTRVMGWNPSGVPTWRIDTDPVHGKGDRRPVTNTSWYAARDFGDKTGLRLPTEAEWEYACRAGTAGVFYGDVDAISWHAKNSGERTHDVGGKAANGFGLHDMIGNVGEWCSDWMHDAAYDARVGGVTDPQGPKFGDHRCERGGGAWADPGRNRTSMRFSLEPDYEGAAFGLRVCRFP
jgi:formylglycine-generating enzyme required for sulfatase activity